MATEREAQLNIRSHFARQRVAELARKTGMSATQIVEEALRAYAPPADVLPGGLVRKGALLVWTGGGRTITTEEALAAIEDVRNERG